MDEAPSPLQSAQLQVVLPGSRASFRRRVIDAMREVVPGSGAFCFFGRENARAYSEGTRLVGAEARPMAATAGVTLSVAFGFDPKSVVATPRRAYTSDELWPDAERALLPYFRDLSLPEGFRRAVLLFLHEGGVLLGLAGLERRADEPAFAGDDTAVLERLAPFCVAGARAQLQYDELSREASALRALGRTSGALFVVDRDRGRVVWAADRENGIEWTEDVSPVEDLLVEAAARALAAKERGDPLPTPPTLPGGTLVSVASIDGDPVFGGARCAVLCVRALRAPPLLEGLSRREREIARLLVTGYSGVNVAALSGLSENTVRTYVRRLYQKLGVNNRADLVRKLVSPEPAAPSSAKAPLAPPPDSSLVAGDDTLD